jgi:hypothetical protein
MLGRKLFNWRHSRASVRTAACLAACETLEARQLLTQFPFNIPQNEGFTSVYLRPGQNDGWVRVHKNSATGTVVHEFTGDSDNGTGMYIVDAGGLANFLFVDQVPAALKPTGTLGAPNDNGIRVEATGSPSTPGHLKIETGPDDHLIRVIESTSSSATVEQRPDIHSSDIGNSRFGAGVNKLTIQTHTSGDANVRVATKEPIVSPPSPPPEFSNLPGLHPNTSLRIESLGPRDEIHLGGATNASVHAVVHTGVGANKVYLKQDKFADGHMTTAIVDFDPTLGGGLESGHLLQVGGAQDEGATGVNCTATLDQVGTTAHTIIVDRVWLTNDGPYGIISGPAFPARLFVTDATTMGELVIVEDAINFVGDPIASVLAPLAVVNSSSTSGRAFVNGRLEFEAGSAPSTVYAFDKVGSLELSRGVVKVNTSADVTAETTSEIATLDIPTTGKFTLQARPSAGDPTKVLAVRVLSMGSPPTGELNLTNNAMIVDYVGLPSPIGTIQSLITSGYNASATPAFWTGKGIRSTTAAAVALDANALKTGLGYVEATDVFTSFPASWEGQSNVDNTSVLVKYTYYGDVNLDEIVNLADFNRLAAFFGQSGMRWNNGDFYYDGNVNLQDFNRQAANFGQSGGLSPLGGEGEYTVEDLLQILVEMYPEYF